MTTKIEWCDLTINPVVGCSKCSPGCDNCYAERIAAMRVKHPNPKISGKYAGTVDERGKWTGMFGRGPRSFHLPKKSQRIFLGSMTDLFHEKMPSQWLYYDIFEPIAIREQHTFMMLTKRPDRMKEVIAYFEQTCLPQDYSWPLPNLWIGVTVCNQAEADEKIPVLLSIPAAKRFVSIEPMLGPINLGFRRAPTDRDYRGWNGDGPIDYVETTRMDDLHWVICGGETGKNARPMHPAWVRSLRDQCTEANVPFFFKGWGEWMHEPRMDNPNDKRRAYFSQGWLFAKKQKEIKFLLPSGETFMGLLADKIEREDYANAIVVKRVGKSRAGRLLDGREWNEFPKAVR